MAGTMHVPALQQKGESTTEGEVRYCPRRGNVTVALHKISVNTRFARPIDADRTADHNPGARNPLAIAADRDDR
jgi:hypothetical protein